jgi:hypothetical protein
MLPKAPDHGWSGSRAWIRNRVSIGFLGYALWRSVQAIADPDREGPDDKALGKRVGYGASALIYAGLAFSAVGLVFGSASSEG